VWECLNCTGVDGAERKEEEQISIESTWSPCLCLCVVFRPRRGAMFGDACEDDDDGRAASSDELLPLGYYCGRSDTITTALRS
jgi:hypothetical protein